MKPTNKNNFLIEVTQEQLDYLKSLHHYDDDDGYEEMHYSPHWSSSALQPTKETEQGE